jgi:hypothetical protein
MQNFKVNNFEKTTMGQKCDASELQLVLWSFCGHFSSN